MSQLIGCGTGTNKDKAEVRITNVSGGTAPYQYKFSGNYSNLNSGWLSAGTHTVYVKDANGCELGMTVTVTAKIPEPTGTTYTITSYDCDGKATVRFTGTPTTYDYTYEIGGKTATGTTTTITGLAPGSYTVTIKYKNRILPISSILLKEDFGSGPETCNPDVNPLFICRGKTGGTMGWAQQGNKSSYLYVPPSVWLNPNDHTSGGADPQGRYMYFDIPQNMMIYQKTVEDVIPNRPIKFEMYLMNFMRAGNNGALPDVTIKIVDPATNAVLGSVLSARIPENNGPNDWHLFSGQLNPGSATRLRIELHIGNQQIFGYYEIGRASCRERV